MQRCRHAAISTHSRMGLWWATNQLPANGEPLDVASPVLRCQGRGYEDAEALHGRRRVCTRHGYLLCAWWGGAGLQRGRGAIPEAGPPGREWIASVAGAGWLFFAGAWLIILMGLSGDRRPGGFLRHPSVGWAGDDSGANSRRRRVDAGDRLAPDPHRDGL